MSQARDKIRGPGSGVGFRRGRPHQYGFAGQGDTRGAVGATPYASSPRRPVMARRLLRGLTFANICSFLALTIALGTGTAYAANTVLSTDIVDGEVKNADLGANSVTSGKIYNNSVNADDIRTDAVTSSRGPPRLADLRRPRRQLRSPPASSGPARSIASRNRQRRGRCHRDREQRDRLGRGRQRLPARLRSCRRFGRQLGAPGRQRRYCRVGQQRGHRRQGRRQLPDHRGHRRRGRQRRGNLGP